ncbi:MAG: C40 family peptidase, partial [Candidatus Bipolaricaulis sp.]|nr:C40 family peptidase [Candidatus Bipolaricaulis sp.]
MNSGQKEKIAAFAVANLGKPYKYGSKPDEAPDIFDCSSFVQYLYKNIGITLPRTALEQAHIGRKINPKSSLEVGDLIFFKGTVGRYDNKFPIGIGHVAIYIGD